MNPLERLLDVIAPHICLTCRSEGTLLCGTCRLEALRPLPSRCYRCHVATAQNRVCRNCRRKTTLSHAWIATRYGDEAKALVHRFKFERAKQAADILVEAIDLYIPLLPKNILVSHVPTASSRIRFRGYDQAQLIARGLCRKRGWSYVPLLVRKGSARQVGATRGDRFAHLEGAFTIRDAKRVAGAHILLIDDVLTTGATIEAAARTLKEVNARTIDAAVFAQP